MTWEYWLDSVLTGNFKMSRPSEFNDPFDCIGAEKGEYSSQVIDDFVEKNYTSDFGSRELFKNIFQLTYKAYGDDECYNRRHLDSLLLIMSMTDAKKVDPQNELLMWSHYAGNAKGVRILFDIPDCNDKYFLAHVSYDSRIPCFDRSLATSYKKGIAFIEFYKKMIYTKSNAWKYENEVRLILHEPDWDPYRIDMNGMSFFKMPKEWIKEVTFGSEVDSRASKMYTNLLRKLGFTNIIFRKTIKKRYEYGLDYDVL